MSTKSSLDTNVHIDEDGFNKMIKWTFVGRGGKKSKESADRYSGITDMKEGGENSTMCFRSFSCHVARCVKFHCIQEVDPRTDDA